MHASTFQYLKPSDTQKADMERCRFAYAAVFAIIEEHVPNGRYKALAVTTLEESAMWANKGVTRDSDGTPREGAEV